ncbi:hypothetical protein HRR76_000777 [Exophiala dermatitidis]|nr:hypothetical protein HRR76_000777 [Exophiala dermatitidis]KAJ4570298.1 hypothetical protein HRR82_007504 [Exophiala dermatitidis]KAJ4692382.1 hypothetical protein HRR87_006578 [Exophiala dermatitidis]KAJ9000566.1 hypothetical protein HRR94_004512 [Exophiala dermatitidis]
MDWMNRKIQSLQHQENNNNPSNDQNPSEDDVEPIEDAEAFSETFVPPKDQCQSLTVDFSITLSPTYYVPVLWFSCHTPSSGDKPLSIEHVYDWLVPHRFRMSLGNVGVMGGISMAVSDSSMCRYRSPSSADLHSLFLAASSCLGSTGFLHPSMQHPRGSLGAPLEQFPDPRNIPGPMDWLGRIGCRPPCPQ